MTEVYEIGAESRHFPPLVSDDDSGRGFSLLILMSDDATLTGTAAAAAATAAATATRARTSGTYSFW